MRRRPSRHLSNERIVLRRQVVEGRDVPPGDDQHVHGRLRVDVLDRDEAIVLVDDGAGYLPGDDPAEQAFRHVIRSTPSSELRSSCGTALLGLP